MDTVATAPRIRWGRALVGALLGEAVLMVVAVCAYATMADPMPLLVMIVPLVTVPIFAGAGYWSARPVPEVGLVQGALAGLLAVAIYAVLLGGEYLFVKAPDFSASLSTSYLISHVLKVIGGALGGWIATQRATASAA